MALISLSQEEWWVVRDACADFHPPFVAQVTILDSALPPRDQATNDQQAISASATDQDAYATACALYWKWGAKTAASKIGEQARAQGE